MSKPLIYDKPMTKAQKCRRYKNKMKDWKDRNYLTFSFHLPKDLVEKFREKTKENGDIQRQLVINMLEEYIKGNNMDKEEYYNRIEKINSRFRTDRVSADEEYQLICQRNYLSTRYIGNLEQQVKKQQEVIEKAIEYVEGHKYIIKHYKPYGTPTGMPNYETQNIAGYRVLLDILKEVSK